MTRFFHLLTTVMMISCFSGMSWAYLGEHTHQLAKVRVQNSPSQIQMQEQTDSQGVVRHVKWTGPRRPSLRDTLGPCYAFYKSEMKTKARARGPAVIHMENDQCKIEVSGGMGHARGEATLK
jgi:hypothetical protein